MNRKFLHFNLIICLVLLSHCANQGGPGGGPVDREPPVIIETAPKTDSIGVPLNLREIYIEFSERMDEGSVRKAIFISPPLNFDQEWSRSRKLRLVITDTLLESQTYVVSIGTGASDEHSNALEASYQFAFSTGYEIDQGSISGRVYGIQKNEVYNIFAFVFGDSGKLNYINTRPRYISQSRKNGQYTLTYLKEGAYRLFAVQDLNNNLQIDTDYEKIGIPSRDVKIDVQQLSESDLNFKIAKIDTTPPFLTGVRPVYDRYVQLRTSEPLILNDNTDFFIIDSLTLDTLQILGSSINEKADNIVDVYTETMDSSAHYQFYCNFIEDSSGNSNMTVQKINFVSNLKIDTTSLKLIEFFPEDSVKSIHPAKPLYVKFSQPVNWKSVESNFRLINSINDTLKGSWDHTSVFEAEFYPASMLDTDSSFTAYLNYGRVSDLWGNLFEDSLIHHYFSIISSRELGEVSGIVLADSIFPKPVNLTLKMISGRKGDDTYRQILKQPGMYKFNNLPDGRYKLSAYWDLDENGMYSAGQLAPFKFAEPFSVLADTIKVRKRWETQNIDINLPVPGSE